mmetsp:Transcript_26682/g.79267  ORF Transcript_26682/g.79267 Transcript_26682/m.79267 type:complete len:310 (+) Transcript_26682:557-1486(+)
MPRLDPGKTKSTGLVFSFPISPRFLVVACKQVEHVEVLDPSRLSRRVEHVAHAVIADGGDAVHVPDVHPYRCKLHLGVRVKEHAARVGVQDRGRHVRVDQHGRLDKRHLGSVERPHGVLLEKKCCAHDERGAGAVLEGFQERCQLVNKLHPHLKAHEPCVMGADVDDQHVVLTRVLQRLLHAQHRTQGAALQEDDGELFGHRHWYRRYVVDRVRVHVLVVLHVEVQRPRAVACRALGVGADGHRGERQARCAAVHDGSELGVHVCGRLPGQQRLAMVVVECFLVEPRDKLKVAGLADGISEDEPAVKDR